MEYPWYSVVNGGALTQGDILRGCPVVSTLLPEESSSIVTDDTENIIEVEEVLLDGIILSQACDIENNKIENLIICPIESRAKFTERLSLAGKSEKGIRKELESIKKGERPGLHLLNKYDPNEDQDFDFDYHIVEFRNLFIVPMQIAREVAKANGDRLRLLPPYREHLSQAFARFFMRVGLPNNITLD